jgi:hypothetical protein
MSNQPALFQLLMRALDEVLSPLLFDGTTEQVDRRAGQRSERVAVEVDDTLRNDEAVAQAGERIAGIAGHACLS